MPDIKFSCPHCDQHLEAPDDMGGEQIECPSCRMMIGIPEATVTKRLARKKPQAALSTPRALGLICPNCNAELPVGAVLCVQCGHDLRTGKTAGTSVSPPERGAKPAPRGTISCPCCAEQILAEAKKCKHCGEWLDGDRQPPSTVGGKGTEVLGQLLVAIPILTAVITMVWVWNLTLADRPRLVMNLLSVGMVVISAILAFLEAQQIDMGQSDDKHDHGPMTWLILMLGIWIIALPAFLKRRSRHGRKSLLLGGTLAVIFFLGAHLLLNIQIRIAEDTVARAPSPVDDTSQSAPVSGAWSEGRQLGRNYGEFDRNNGNYSMLHQDAANRILLCQYLMGSSEFGDFWAGYDAGYKEAR